MHTLVFLNQNSYKEGMSKLVSQISLQHPRACYISFTDPYHIVIDLLQDAKVHEQYIIVDASSDTKEVTNVNENTYVVSVDSLFDVYVFLANLIKEQKVSALLLDSLSALITKHPTLPLKTMLTNLLLQVGSMKCSTSLVAYSQHENHDVISHLGPFIAKSQRFY